MGLSGKILKRGAIRFLASALCVAVSLAIASAQQVDLQERLEYYAIRGRSADAILKEMRALGPLGVLDPEHRYFASANYQISWKYFYVDGADGCAISQFDVGVDITYLYPRWEDRSEASSRLNAYWDHFLEKLEIHEKGHGEIAAATGAEVAKALGSLAPAATCDALERTIDAAAQAAMKSGNARQRDYDLYTHHGATQGAVFEVSASRRFKAPKAPDNNQG